MAVLSPLEQHELAATVRDLEYIANRMPMSDDARARLLSNVNRLQRLMPQRITVAPAQRVLE